MKKATVVQEEVLKKIKPNSEDRSKIDALAKKLERAALVACREQNIEATVRVEGSVAKDTWIREKPEIDIFVRLPTSISRSSLAEIGLKIGRDTTKGYKQIERFAEHPYLEAFVDNVRVNIVPCYHVTRGEWLSATDRTPFHTDFVRKNLKSGMRDEVRLLKRFLQGIEAYGAEIKIGGFSGYLCELLILQYKSFIETLRSFANFSQRITIDIEGYYINRREELELLFSGPLIVVDPVDIARNVASAVSPHKLYTVIAAARAFLKAPNTKFFYPTPVTPLSLTALKSKLEKKGTSIVILKLGKIEAVPDVLWGQLYKTQRALRKLAELNDFTVLRNKVWSNEKSLTVFVFELEHHIIPNVIKHRGPPLKNEAECENFLIKYTNHNRVVTGPYIDNGRWVVDLRRRFTDFIRLLKIKLQKDGRKIGVAKRISEALLDGFEVMVNDEVLDFYQSNKDFAEYFTAFLHGKPLWLLNDQACH